ncbi:MAG: aminoacyl-tRNA hydrolase [Fuerstiella sp.]|nr:aminoacyl-tRNA hydrolase [Fuerstiella sp.]
MKLIIGLGNPGSQYVGTRHNVGFEIVGELRRRFQAGPVRNRYKSESVEIQIGTEKVLLIAPLTFMNCSGESVIRFVNFYQPDLADLVVVCDDLNLPNGRIRWRAKGSAGGQNGLKDIISRLGSNEFPRLRIGIGRPPGRMDATSWVLGRFCQEERCDHELATARAADSLEKWVYEGLDPVMNEFNRDPDIQ